MRIVGNIEYPGAKVTIFHYENRYSVKIENDRFEQTYKIRRGPGVDTVEEVKTLIDATFIQDVIQNFQTMNKIQLDAWGRVMKIQEDEFEEII